MNSIWYFYFKMIFKLKSVLKEKQNIYFKKQIQLTCKSFISPLRVNGPSWVSRNTVLGRNVNFNGMKIGGSGKVVIGDNFHSGVGCKIITQIHNYEGECLPYDNKIILKDTYIGNNVWLGDDVIILGGVRVGEGVIIQAGSVVVSDIPDYAIAGGHPARVFKQRNIEHYKMLEKQGKFH